jgi:uncharacterized YceG family protein
MSDDNDDDLTGPQIGTAAPGPAIERRPRISTPPPRRRRSRTRYRVRRAIALFALVVVGFAAWFAFELFQPFTGSGTGRVVVKIPRGSARAVGDLLARRGVVDSGFFFYVRAVLDGDRSKLRAGTFTLRHGMSYAAALSVLTAPAPRTKTPPPAATVRITIPEGFRRAQIAVLARDAGLSGSYLAASRRVSGFHPRAYGVSRHVPSLEGFLFPATYYMRRGESVRTLVAEQLTAFQQNFDGLRFARAKAARLSRYDALIVASIVQSEAKVPGDFAKVAAVIYNRLRLGMRLQVESTVRYFLHDFTHPITGAQLTIDNPYNTYVHAGLPPTPIGNPGLEALTAAAHPAHASYLYYVNKPYTCGQLAFATTYSEFLSEENAYNTARAKNGYREPSRCS